MKFLILLLLSMFVCTSCGLKEKQIQRIKAEEEQLKKDSLEQVRIDSISRYAWGDLQFGMTVSEARNTKTLNKGHIKRSDDRWVYMNKKEADSFKTTYKLKYFKDFEVCFEDGFLKEIYINSRGVDYSEIDGLVKDCASFLSEYENITGEHIGLPSNFDDSNLLEGKVARYSRFNQGKRVLFIGLDRNRREGKYCYFIHVYRKNISY